MSEGWIKLHRKLSESSFKDRPLIFALFVDLLLNANHEEKKIIWNKEEMVVGAGQLITGRKTLSKRTGISEQSVRSALNTLKSTNTITIKVTSKFSIISILNWSRYQGQLTSTPTIEPTNNQPATNQQLTTNNNDKNDNNEKNEEYIQPEKISNNLNLSKSQLIAFAREFKGLTTSDIKAEVTKCNAYMAMSSEKYTNPGLFFKKWLARTQKESLAKQAEQNRMEASINNLPELTPEEHQRAQERLAEIRSRFGSKPPRTHLSDDEVNTRRNELLKQADKI